MNQRYPNELSVYGTIGRKNPTVNVPFPYRRLQFRSPNGTMFSMSLGMLTKHLLCIGGPGSGKTNTINLTLEQLRYVPQNGEQRSGDAFVIFDTKGDYIQQFYKPGDTVIATGSQYHQHPGYAVWNIFEELRAAGSDWRMAAREISKCLFADRANQTQPFFSNAAEDLFSAILVHLFKHHQGDPGVLNNQYLVRLIREKPVSWYLDTLCNPEINPEFVGMRSYFGDGKSNQALGVFGELKSMVYSCFTGAFEQNGRFSIRQAVRNRGGKAVFIEYDMSVGQSLTPMYRLLVDLALKETMGRSSQSDGRVWYILDELKLLPHCLHLEDGLNLGRSLGCSIIAGLQSVNQMYELYGREGGQVILGGFSNIFAFSTTDYESRDYISNLYGRNIVKYWTEPGQTPDTSVSIREGRVVEEWDLQHLEPGEAYISLIGYDPFLFQFEPCFD